MKKWGRIWLGLFCALLVFTSSCVYTRVDELMSRRREYQTFKPKQYVEPTKYLNANGVDYAYIEKGQGPTVILMHGGVFTMDFLESLAVNPYWDTVAGVSGLVETAIPYEIVVLLTANTTYGLAMLVPFHDLLPARAQSLIHFGAVSTIDTWQFNFEQLAEKYNVIALDLPGFGSSSKPDIQYSVPEMTQLLNQFIEAKGLKQVVLVGQDFSGEIAIDYALTYPNRVSGLVLVSPCGVESHRIVKPTHLWWHWPRWIARHVYRDKAARVDLFRNLLKVSGKQTYEKLFFVEPSKIYDRTSDKTKTKKLIYNNSPESKKFVDEIVQYKFESGWMKTKDFNNELYATHLALVDTKRKDYWGIISMKDDKRTDWITRIKLIQAPTLIIRGKFDPVLSAEDAQYMNEVIPHSNLSTYYESSHYPMVEESNKFNRDVIDFISGTSVGGAPVEKQK